MGLIASSFGVAAVAAVAVSGLAGRRHTSFRVALLLLAFWATANALPSWADPLMDTVGFYVAFFIAYDRPGCRWCWVLLAAFTAQLIVHVAFLFDGNSYWRMLILNILFAVELICVSVPGGIVGLRRLRDSWSGLHHARAHPRPACRQEQETGSSPAPAGTLKVAAPSRHRR